MLNHMALNTSMVAFLGTIAPAQAGDGSALPVVRLVLDERSGADAYDGTGLGSRRPLPQLSPPGGIPAAPAAKEESNDLRDIVGSLPAGATPAETLASLGTISGFSFCDCAGAAQPLQSADGFGSEARLRQQWTARLTSFRYDLGHPGFLAPPAQLEDLPQQEDGGN